MTPSEKNIVKCLVAVAWADGKLAAPELLRGERGLEADRARRLVEMRMGCG